MSEPLSPAFRGMGELTFETKLSLISETRQLFGIRAARRLWSELGLPQPPDREHPRACAVVSFLKATTEPDPLSELPFSEIYQRYLIWAGDTGSAAIIGQHAFGKYLTRSGLVTARKSGSTIYAGIKWKGRP
ncbi:hypothetical protein FJ970_22610 [Mesorhizobium sp. B2-1-8]|uniref:hypothetical protein n=1 Tax=Mesorhizobium sp. B2-1-8 TaxID=2589967 RepID=UPI001173017E|nr:hypothetical protein [Mesorhizobium sp. B2-1-8]UCI17875.1 hypothetical protein FJ970_22610 [Mesorhizobium sp. B2-1-8]